MLEIKSLTKELGNKKVIDQITFSIGEGEAIGIVGPNGSGKTTLLNLLIGCITADSGGFEYRSKVKPSICISRKGFINDMTVKDNLAMWATIQGIETNQLTRLCE